MVRPVGRPRTRKFENKTGILREDFLDHIKSTYFEDYVGTIYPLIQTEPIYEEVCERTQGGDIIVNEKILVPELDDKKELTITEVFNGIEQLVKHHNKRYFNEQTGKGIEIKTIKSKGGSSKKRNLKAVQGGVERNVCLIPFIRGISKYDLEEFIMGVMNYRSQFKSFVPDPSRPDSKNLFDPKQLFRTFCNRTNFKDFFYTNISYERDLVVVLPSYNGKDLTRLIKREDDDSEIWKSPELQLLSIMAYYLNDNHRVIEEEPEEVPLKVTEEKNKIFKEKGIDAKKIIRLQGPVPRNFPQGEPISQYQALKILNKYSLDQIYDVLEPWSEAGEGNRLETFDNPFEACGLISGTVNESKKVLSKNPAGFNTTYIFNWKTFFERRVKEIEETEGFKKHPTITSPESNWGKSSIDNQEINDEDYSID